MFRKLTLALAAATSLGAASLASTAGSASPLWVPHHPHHIGLGIGFGYGYGGYDGCYRTRLVPTPFGLRYRVVNVCAW